MIQYVEILTKTIYMLGTNLHYFKTFTHLSFYCCLCILISSCTREPKVDHLKDDVAYYYDLSKRAEIFIKHIEATDRCIKEAHFEEATKRLSHAAYFAQDAVERHRVKDLRDKIVSHYQKSYDKADPTYKREKHTDYLHSEKAMDLMLAYNYAATHLRSLVEDVKSIRFPNTHIKKDHIVHHKGTYVIRSFVYIESQSTELKRHTFNCEIQLHKDRRNYDIKFFELIS